MRTFFLLSLLWLLPLWLVSCRSKDSSPGVALASASVPPPPPPVLPAPYEDIRLGMSLDEVTRLFPASEPLGACQMRFVGAQGGSSATKKEGAEEPERETRCASAGNASGVTTEELLGVMMFLSENNKSEAAAEKTAAWMTVMEQVRGAVRAGVLTEEQLLAAIAEQPADAQRAPAVVAATLFDGAMTFVRPKQARRPICATVSDDCSGIDPERARQYVLGNYSLGQIDQQARVRVANGKCRGAYVQNEGSMQRGFAMHTGALAGIGLARASRPDRQLVLETPSTYATYTLRSGLRPEVARLGVRIANGLLDIERFWSGVIALHSKAPSPLGAAMIWLDQGKVARVMINLTEGKKATEVQQTLTHLYGSPGQTSGRQVRWTLPGGAIATLDLGAAFALRLGPAGAWAPAPPSSAAPAASSRLRRSIFPR